MCPTKSLISSHFVGVVYHNLDDEAIYDRISACFARDGATGFRPYGGGFEGAASRGLAGSLGEEGRRGTANWGIERMGLSGGRGGVLVGIWGWSRGGRQSRTGGELGGRGEEGCQWCAGECIALGGEWIVGGGGEHGGRGGGGEQRIWGLNEWRNGATGRSPLPICCGIPGSCFSYPISRASRSWRLALKSAIVRLLTDSLT